MTTYRCHYCGHIFERSQIVHETQGIFSASTTGAGVTLYLAFDCPRCRETVVP